MLTSLIVVDMWCVRNTEAQHLVLRKYQVSMSISVGKAQNTKSGFATHPTNSIYTRISPLLFSLLWQKYPLKEPLKEGELVLVHSSEVRPLCRAAGPRVSWSHCVSQEAERNEGWAQLVFSSIQLRNLACETMPPTFRINPLTPLSPIKKKSLQSRPGICPPGLVKLPVNINYHKYYPLTWKTAKCPRQLQDWDHLVVST